MSFSCRIYPLVQPVLKRIRRSRWVIQRLFGVSVPSGTLVQFDPVTVLLAKAVPELIEAKQNQQDEKRPVHVFEMGVGEGALVTLSIAKWHKSRCNLDNDSMRSEIAFSGVDCSATRVASSSQVAKFNSVDSRFWVSDLFSEVVGDHEYDFVLFNPPYVSTEVGKSLRLTERLGVDGDQMWDGGEDGTQVLREFLREAQRVLRPGGVIIFGVQPIFVEDSAVRRVVEQAGYQIVSRLTKKGVPAVGYVVTVVEDPV